MFLVSAAAAFLSIVLLTVVISWTFIDDGSQPASAGSRDTPTETGAAATATPTPGPLLYEGAAPPFLPPSEYAPVQPGQTADVLFAAEGATTQFASHYFIPVAALGAGVDALTADQLRGLLDGSITDWADVGGISGPVVPVLTGPGEDVAAVQAMVSVQAATSYPDYATLRAAMTIESGLITLVPLAEVRPNVTAIAIDGLDVVRGDGDPRDWPFATVVSASGLTPRGEDGLRSLEAAFSAPLPHITTVIATGDILMSRCSLQRIIESGDWASALRGPVADYLASADLTIGSVDGSIQDINEPLLCAEHVNLSSPPEVMEAFTLAGIDEVTIATNHIFDCGVAWCGNEAFLRTLELFAEAGIATVGGGHTLEEALAPAIIEANGISFGMVGFDDVAAMELEAEVDTPGTAPLDDTYDDERAGGGAAFYYDGDHLGLERYSQTISDLAGRVDVAIVQVQSGIEDTHTPSSRSLKALPAAVDAGSVLVIGNHPHHAQAIQAGDTWFIAYALGNFVYDQVHTPEHQQGYLVEATFWGAELRNVRLVPYQIENLYKPVFAEGELRAKILNDVFTASVPLE